MTALWCDYCEHSDHDKWDRIYGATACSWSSAEECAMVAERSVAGRSNVIPGCMAHGRDVVVEPLSDPCGEFVGLGAGIHGDFERTTFCGKCGWEYADHGEAAR